MITVATWNVLHRIHADNWGGFGGDRWPDEAERVAAVTETVAGRAEHIIALQEVSGDLLTSLRLALPDRSVHALRYPRVPIPRRRAADLVDPAEYLVLLVDGPAKEVAAAPFPDDPGNGAITVHASGLRVTATHITGDRRGRGQIASLATQDDPVGRPTVLLGDFNTDRAGVADALGPEFTLAPIDETGLPTRPRTSGPKSQFIDHIAVRGAHVGAAVVEDVKGRSDHNLVRAVIETRPSANS
ncbi:endonuclease/exonuclease/phosphatase family protein [Nocardia puris]|uniref:Endonuclease/exonuclease/phosphatase family metal-dependent hydrolase n=1 Tax=Nocardia puris TaxID=208602 RepID=A0A366DV04_9NOCA|nr:endonuclease/exonuclease/phosphatase family protein [Nocardia puris]MBF6210495.1 endonuclease/exonuclease/phosphatase family protein [Nocardia puris]MBF6457755.1 endonuclease/exonuclease/phosphatase family protein [Nocardia puris]RBO93922.1 endonuclease/exonuclease/phosphatase family metal-dependent hydrolase [Nocardia puris]